MQQTNIDKIRHTLSHLLASVVLEKYPDTKLAIGPTIDNGFYYDFKFSKPISPEDLKDIRLRMIKLANGSLAMKSEEKTIEEALAYYTNLDQPFKIELINDLAKEGNKTVSFYTLGNFTDLCRGGHVESTKDINLDAFVLDRIAGAYWRGDEKNPMLTRIYGLAFESKQELFDYKTKIEEAKKRDHKKLGQELDLFTFSDLVGAGLPLWTPKGTLLRDTLNDYVWQLRKEKGYVKVSIPHITKKELYETSGHWQKFKDELFKIKSREGHEFAMKPMNCPHHTQIFARKMTSYKEMPQRYAETTTVYRDEQTGELSGLSRTRAISQDDAHVFCRSNQVKQEMSNIWDIIQTFYKKVGFGELKVRLSLHDPEKMDAYLGSEETWQKAESDIRELAKSQGADFVEAVGEAAFYGPKIDFIACDSLGREWQVATIQLDMNMPERFDLNCINEKGEKEQVVMIHAAIMGSIERFLSILIEHLGGSFPVWLAPTQVKIIPVSDQFNDYANELAKKLSSLRLEIDIDSESVGKKIRNAEMQKVPYMIVVGEKEKTSGKLAVRKRSEHETRELTIEEFLAEI